MTGNATNAVAVRDGKAGAVSQIVSWAKGSDPDPRDLPRDLLAMVPDVIRRWEADLRPLKVIEPDLRGSETRKVKQAFLPLGVKLQPNMASDKAEPWTHAMVAALSDLPARCIIKAMGTAMHVVYRFSTDLENDLRRMAKSNLETDLAYIQRLRQLATPRLWDCSTERKMTEPNEPYTKEQIRDLVTSNLPSKATLVRLGLSCGAIDATLLAQVRTEEGLEDEASE